MDGRATRRANWKAMALVGAVFGVDVLISGATTIAHPAFWTAVAIKGLAGGVALVAAVYLVMSTVPVAEKTRIEPLV